VAMAIRRQRRAFPLVPFLVSLLAVAAYGRLISDGMPATPSSSVLASPLSSAAIRLNSSSPATAAAPEECEQTYGFLPCTTTVFGNMFLVLTYGFLMFKAATFLSAGSELLLEIMGPGLVGGLLLPILGALPDALLVLGMLALASLLKFYLWPLVQGPKKLLVRFSLKERMICS
uniref:Sodium/calcium exchanger membrane region domain-containing protein n=1 Tax=Aegilops tauschii subsp. strangulata TaxID=200361 RepID=A0A453EEK2_AEGTS